MRYVSGQRLKNISAALLLSAFIAGAICALTSPVTPNNESSVTISVNRAGKGDRLPQIRSGEPIRKSGRQDSLEKPAPSQTPNQTPIGCEAAFSPVAHPGRSDILTHCAA